MKSTPKAILKKLSRSATFQEYERAFQESTDLPLTLTPLETWRLPQHGRANENRFCALIARDPRACAGCLMNQKKLCGQATSATTIHCFPGFAETAIPVKVNDQRLASSKPGRSCWNSRRATF